VCQRFRHSIAVLLLTALAVFSCFDSRGQGTVNVTWSFTNFVAQPAIISSLDVEPLCAGPGVSSILVPQRIIFNVLNTPSMRTSPVVSTNLLTGYGYALHFNAGWGIYSFTNYFPTNLTGTSVQGVNYVAYNLTWPCPFTPAFLSPIVSNITYAITVNGFTNAAGTNSAYYVGVSASTVVVSTNYDALYVASNALAMATNSFDSNGAAIYQISQWTNGFNGASNALQGQITAQEQTNLIQSNIWLTTKQPASANLTNWSAVPTNQFITGLTATNSFDSNNAAFYQNGLGSNFTLLIATALTNDVLNTSNILQQQITAAASTNGINSNYFQFSKQPASGNLSNWSIMPTNVYISGLTASNSFAGTGTALALAALGSNNVAQSGASITNDIFGTSNVLQAAITADIATNLANSNLFQLGKQPASLNLTNWSSVPTNNFITGLTATNSFDSNGAAIYQGTLGSNNVNQNGASITNDIFGTSNILQGEITAGAATNLLQSNIWSTTKQPASLNLTNWSSMPTNVYVSGLTATNSFDSNGAAIYQNGLGTNFTLLTGQANTNNALAISNYLQQQISSVIGTNTLQSNAWQNGRQPATANLTNWSSVPTNQFITGLQATNAFDSNGIAQAQAGLGTNFTLLIGGNVTNDVLNTSNVLQSQITADIATNLANSNLFQFSKQPASGNLSNWSIMPTNVYISGLTASNSFDSNGAAQLHGMLNSNFTYFVASANSNNVLSTSNTLQQQLNSASATNLIQSNVWQNTKQPATANLTNWSLYPTNAFIGTAQGFAAFDTNGAALYAHNWDTNYANTNTFNQINSATNRAFNFVQETNGVAHLLTVPDTLILNQKTNFVGTANVIGVVGQYGGTFLGNLPFSNIWTNQEATQYTIVSNSPAMNLQSNGVTVATFPIALGQGYLVPSAAAGPYASFGGFLDINGFYLRGILASTNLLAALQNSVGVPVVAGYGLTNSITSGTNIIWLNTNTVITLIDLYATSPTNGVGTNYINAYVAQVIGTNQFFAAPALTNAMYTNLISGEPVMSGNTVFIETNLTSAGGSTPNAYLTNNADANPGFTNVAASLSVGGVAAVSVSTTNISNGQGVQFAQLMPAERFLLGTSNGTINVIDPAKWIGIIGGNNNYIGSSVFAGQSCYIFGGDGNIIYAFTGTGITNNSIIGSENSDIYAYSGPYINNTIIGSFNSGISNQPGGTLNNNLILNGNGSYIGENRTGGSGVYSNDMAFGSQVGITNYGVTVLSDGSAPVVSTTNNQLLLNYKNGVLLNGSPLSGSGGAQTPWLSDINADLFNLTNATQIIGVPGGGGGAYTPFMSSQGSEWGMGTFHAGTLSAGNIGYALVGPTPGAFQLFASGSSPVDLEHWFESDSGFIFSDSFGDLTVVNLTNINIVTSGTVTAQNTSIANGNTEQDNAGNVSASGAINSSLYLLSGNPVYFQTNAVVTRIKVSTDTDTNYNGIYGLNSYGYFTNDSGNTYAIVPSSPFENGVAVACTNYPLFTNGTLSLQQEYPSFTNYLVYGLWSFVVGLNGPSFGTLSVQPYGTTIPSPVTLTSSNGSVAIEPSSYPGGINYNLSAGAGVSISQGVATNTTTVVTANPYIFIGTNYDGYGSAAASIAEIMGFNQFTNAVTNTQASATLGGIVMSTMTLSGGGSNPQINLGNPADINFSSSGFFDGIVEGTAFEGYDTVATFYGNGQNLTSLTPANISSGTAGINITGNASTATTALGVTLPNSPIVTITSSNTCYVTNSFFTFSSCNAMWSFLTNNPVWSMFTNTPYNYPYGGSIVLDGGDQILTTPMRFLCPTNYSWGFSISAPEPMHTSIIFPATNSAWQEGLLFFGTPVTNSPSPVPGYFSINNVGLFAANQSNEVLYVNNINAGYMIGCFGGTTNNFASGGPGRALELGDVPGYNSSYGWSLSVARFQSRFDNKGIVAMNDLFDGAKYGIIEDCDHGLNYNIQGGGMRGVSGQTNGAVILDRCAIENEYEQMHYVNSDFGVIQNVSIYQRQSLSETFGPHIFRDSNVSCDYCAISGSNLKLGIVDTLGGLIVQNPNGAAVNGFSFGNPTAFRGGVGVGSTVLSTNGLTTGQFTSWPFGYEVSFANLTGDISAPYTNFWLLYGNPATMLQGALCVWTNYAASPNNLMIAANDPASPGTLCLESTFGGVNGDNTLDSLSTFNPVQGSTWSIDNGAGNIQSYQLPAFSTTNSVSIAAAPLCIPTMPQWNLQAITNNVPNFYPFLWSSNTATGFNIPVEVERSNGIAFVNFFSTPGGLLP
jgi:hypothetical protein